MDIVLKAIHKNVEINITGKGDEEVADKLVSIINLINEKGLKISDTQKAASPENTESTLPKESPVQDSIGIKEKEVPQTPNPQINSIQRPYSKLIKYDRDEPRLNLTNLKLPEKPKVARQSQAILIVSYILTTVNNVHEFSTIRVSQILQLSGIDTFQIGHATKKLEDEKLIMRKGDRSFTLTSPGEDYAKKLLDEAESSLTG